MEESLIHFETDIDCEVYKFGNLLCEVKCGTDVCASFRKGSFKLKFVSSINSADFYEIIYNVNEAGIETFYTITLKPIQDKRLLEEKKEREYKMALQKKAEEEQMRLDRLREVQKREEDALKQAQSHFIDLGLSVKWGTCNLGAMAPERSGHFYAWGETNGKHSFGAGLYKHYEPAEHYAQFKRVLKYGKNALMGENKKRLDSIDDAATSYLGGGYRIPSEREWEELRSKCSFEQTVFNGVEGYTVRSRVKGFEDKSIFLPLTGFYLWNGYKTAATCYWTSDLGNELYSACNFYAKVFVLKHWRLYSCNIGEEERHNGYPIRPVCDMGV